jgi:small subunit ribosomal protein S6
MREYELTVVYDLAVAEAGGPDASVEQLRSAVEARGGRVLKVDHWGRRRMAYPINRAIDGDYIVSRIELEPASVAPMEAAFKINERVYRHLVVRADELPVPPPPREPRQQPAAAATGPVEPPPVADRTGVPEQPATTAEASSLAEAEASPEAVSPAPGEAPPAESAPPSGTIASEARATAEAAAEEAPAAVEAPATDEPPAAGEAPEA